MSATRLDKYLSNAGIGTRSEIKKYIKQGFVSVNGASLTSPEVKIDPSKDIIAFKGSNIFMEEFEYFLLNKPAGYVSTTKDNIAPTVMTLIDSRRKDLFPVGRLDKDTEGLLLITNDGALSHRLLSPKNHIDKTYYAVIEGKVNEEDIKAFENGLHIGDEDLDTALPSKLVIKSPYNMEENHSYVEVTIQEGKFHQVKRMFKAIGKNVIYLKRIKMGSLTLPDDLPLGASRPLTDDELNHFNNLKH